MGFRFCFFVRMYQGTCYKQAAGCSASSTTRMAAGYRTCDTADSNSTTCDTTGLMTYWAPLLLYLQHRLVTKFRATRFLVMFLYLACWPRPNPPPTLSPTRYQVQGTSYGITLNLTPKPCAGLKTPPCALVAFFEGSTTGRKASLDQ